MRSATRGFSLLEISEPTAPQERPQPTMEAQVEEQQGANKESRSTSAGSVGRRSGSVRGVPTSKIYAVHAK